MSIFKCKMCGGTLEITEGATTAECNYCGSMQTLPRLDDERKANLYDRANHFRRNNEYDKARAIYENILNEDNTDAESYWSIILCEYGIEYVEDPLTHKRVPTVNRAQFASVLSDENYKKAIEYADINQRIIYEKEAAAIDEIQKGILSISQKEEPFDIFICYKETDTAGRRTPDSVLANDLYHQLTQEGFKVFFSRITLEDKLGSAYEPYIFAALNSAKVMVVVGTKPEYFNAVWVKNEWNRFLGIVKASGGRKALIPAYKDMDPYDLPEEFSHLQAQDMSKLGFMQDLLRGIKKIVKGAETPVKTVQTQTAEQGSTKNLIKRTKIFLEDRDWKSADEYCEKVLDLDPENCQAYIYKLMAKAKCSRPEELKTCELHMDKDYLFGRILKYSKDPVKEKIIEIADANSNHIKYREAKIMYESDKKEDIIKAEEILSSLEGFQDSRLLIDKCQSKIKDIKLEEALRVKKDTIEHLKLAAELFDELDGWKDSKERAEDCRARIAEKEEEEEKKSIKAKVIKKRILIGAICAVILCGVGFFSSKIIQHVMLERNIPELKAVREELDEEYIKGTVSARGNNTIGLKKDGTVVATGNNEYSQCDVEGWRDIVAVSVGASYYTVGLKKDGTVVATGNNEVGQCDVEGWRDIVAVSAGDYHTVGLKKDGTVVATGYDGVGQCYVEGWRDIVAVSAGFCYTVGLKKNGTVVARGYDEFGQCDVKDWRDIVAVSAGLYYTVGLKKDGTVVATGINEHGQCDVEGWKDIVAVSAEDYHTVGLKKDGTVVATGNNEYGQCDVEGWRDIVAVSTGFCYTVGLKRDGTVVATGNNAYSQRYVKGWKNIRTSR